MYGASLWLRWQTICLNAGDLGSISGLGRSPGEGNGYPLQVSCLENYMDRGSWRVTVHGVTEWVNNILYRLQGFHHCLKTNNQLNTSNFWMNNRINNLFWSLVSSPSFFYSITPIVYTFITVHCNIFVFLSVPLVFSE